MSRSRTATRREGAGKPRGAAARAGAATTPDDEPAARAIEVRGVVQGVGFRPFVWRLAERLGVAGWVRNADGIVQIHAEAPERVLEEFCAALEQEAPPLARVEEVRQAPVAHEGLEGFQVDESRGGPGGDRLVSPDVATCPSCLRELFDPNDRRHRYPFTNCTDCGPRFTIIESLPYDRERTSMRTFPLCDDCAREYADPADRRFHAEPVACPACGPELGLLDRHGKRIPGDPIEKAAGLLRKGRILALKGLGGFHLACDATSEHAVNELRRRKERPDKPLAVMFRDLEAARDYVKLSDAEAELLSSWRAPIVLAPDLGKLAPSVAPGHRRQGAMLPSTPLHHLLLAEVDLPLVMTSGNLTEEPICISNEEALERLANVADAFLVHDREIVARYDDSVTRVWRGTPIVFRRARSYAPSPVELPVDVAPTLGTGAELHGAFCLAAGRRAFLSQHVGHLDTEESMAAYADALNRHGRVFGLEPEVVAHDLHPNFLTTRFAEETGLPRVAVQHHHAHVVAVMAEHALTGQVIGVAFDGFGLGDDGEAWGGEFLVCDWASATRVAHLRPVRQPGGDAAVRNPVRMAIAHAADAGVLEKALKLLRNGHDDPSGITQEELDVILGQLESGLSSPWTSSGGRLFDAVAALTGVCRLATYEGEPAILLEQIAEPGATFEYAFDVAMEDGRLVIDTRPIVAGMVKDLTKGRSAGEVAGRFHNTLAAAILEGCRVARGGTGLNRVCLAGGVFQNDLLVSGVAARLQSCDFEVYVPREVPVGDGGISLGQVLVAHARTEG